MTGPCIPQLPPNHLTIAVVLGVDHTIPAVADEADIAAVFAAGAIAMGASASNAHIGVSVARQQVWVGHAQ